MTGRIRKAVDAMAGYVPGEQPGEPGVIKLNTNENPYPPSPDVTATLAAFNAESLCRYPDPAAVALRTRIAELHDCAPGQVLVGNGSDELLALGVRAFVERGAAVGYFDPSYSLYPVLAQIEEAPVETTPLGPDFEWTAPRTERCSLFFLTSPNAPTGLLYAEEQVRDFAASFQGVVVLDEAYADFAPRNGMHLVREYENLLVVRSFSKSYSLAGLRLGYAVGSETLIAALAKIKDSYNVGRLAQEVGLAAVNDQAAMRRNVQRICATRQRVGEALTSAGFAVCPSATNFLWVRPPGGLSASGWFEALRRRRILVRYFPGPQTGAFLRITIGDDAQMDAFLEAVKNLGA